MGSEAEERSEWIAEILDVLSNRNSATFTHQNPDAMLKVAQMLSQRNWDEILTENLLGSPRFQTDLERLLDLAPREMLQVKTHRLRMGLGVSGGRLLAAETLKQRILKRSPTLWVRRESRKVWQTPANAASAGFLHALLRNCREASSNAQPTSVVRGISRLALLVRSEPLRHVDPDVTWKSYVFPGALTTKSEFYRTIWRWMKHYRIASRSRDASTLRQILLGGWLISEKDERLLELYALSVTLKALMNLREWDSFDLIANSRVSGSTHIVAKLDSVTVRIDFDKSPDVEGRYRWLLARYSRIDGRGRRPDLQITSSSAERALTTLIEVKATTPNSPYGRDSVVKVMGYLHDFADLWVGEPSMSYCRAVLLYRDSAGPLVDSSVRAREDEVLLTGPKEFEAAVTAIMDQHLKLLTLNS